METRIESDLIAHGRNGDTQALSELFERHYSSSMRVARAILRSDEDAPDVVQTAYLAAFQHFREFRGDAQFKTWITQIVKNHCLMQLRRSARRQFANLDEGVPESRMGLLNPEPSPEDVASRSEMTKLVSSAIGRLPKRLKDVYMLCGSSDVAVKQAAKTLGLSVPAAKTRLYRAQHRLRSEIGRSLAPRGRSKAAERARHSAHSTPVSIAA